MTSPMALPIAKSTAADLGVKRVHLKNVVWKGPWGGIVAGPHDYCIRNAIAADADVDAAITQTVAELVSLVHADIKAGRKITRWVFELEAEAWPKKSDPSIVYVGAYAKAMRSMEPQDISQ